MTCEDDREGEDGAGGRPGPSKSTRLVLFARFDGDVLFFGDSPPRRSTDILSDAVFETANLGIALLSFSLGISPPLVDALEQDDDFGESCTDNVHGIIPCATRSHGACSPRGENSFLTYLARIKFSTPAAPSE